MAKQVVNPFERHVEKGLLVVAGLVLIGVIVMYVVTSPNKVEIDGQSVRPGDIGARLSQKATDVRQTIRSARPEEPDSTVLAERWKDALRREMVSQFRAALPLGPEVPFVDPKGAKPGQAQLVHVLPPHKPAVTHGRSTLELQDGSVFQPTNWVTVAAVFDLEEQSKIQALEYGSQRKNVVFGSPQLQRRPLRSDGTWSDEDWEDVQSWPASKVRTPPVVEFAEERGRQVVPRENRSDIERYQDHVEVPAFQLELLRPLFPDIFNGKPWDYPRAVPCRDVLRMDDDYLNAMAAEVTPDGDLEDRYGTCGNLPVAGTPAVVNTIAGRMAAASQLLERANKIKDADLALMAFNEFVDITHDLGATAAEKTRATRLRDKAEQDARDITRDNRRRPVEDAVSDDEEEEERALQPRQLIWMHDARPGSVESGKSYQYRMRATLFNRLAGEPAKFEDNESAKVIFVAGEWSEPTETIVVPPTIEFYVTNVDARKEVAKIEIYQWFDGQWVTTRETFQVGDRLAVQDRAEIPAVDNPEEVDRALVDFDAGVTVLRIITDRALREKKERGGGVRFQDSLSNDFSVILADLNGNVIERFVETDKANPDKKAASLRVWRPRRKGG